ncbi:MAG TPA: hypothetical protein VE993_17770 [Stellaceae bacterium]|nr:hypothetical protein [Stellaceae bacterium]
MRDSPYWVSPAPRCGLGYRKGPKDGIWLAKIVHTGMRQQTTLGPADDALDEAAKVVPMVGARW